MSNPAMPGAKSRLMFIPALLRAMAFMRRSRLTSSAMMAWRDGNINAMMIPWTALAIKR